MPETISYSDLRRGTVIELDGEPYQVVEWKHVIMQQRTPVLSLKLRHLKTGRVLERNLPGYTRLVLAEVETRESQYLYYDGHNYVFMDTETYDQFPLTADQVGEGVQYMKEGLPVKIVYYRGQPVALELPNFVELKVTETSPAFKGDTAQSGRKPATLETGAVVKVPMHVKVGDIIKVDTRTGEYIETVS
ncbi:MAG: elongation factor P [Dehalococcoidia bacterium]|nr:elongation factor P [Dehalococcoidia bacterium]MDW8119177.1 elongation factor P [Chloroflexota bacterium]